MQEGLSNIWKHAQASAVHVRLKHTSPRTLLMSIADKGRGLLGGFDLAGLAVGGHYGLLGLSECVALLEGRLHVQNQAGGGLLLQVEIHHPRVDVGVPAPLESSASEISQSTAGRPIVFLFCLRWPGLPR